MHPTEIFLLPMPRAFRFILHNVALPQVIGGVPMLTIAARLDPRRVASAYDLETTVAGRWAEAQSTKTMARSTPQRRRVSAKAVDPFLVHEALDRAHLATEIVEAHLATHAFIRSTPKLKKQADAIVERLAALYQAIGAM